MDRTDETEWVMSHPRFLVAKKASEVASEARFALPAGSSRKRVTSANARWSTKAEARDRIEQELRTEYQARKVT